MIFLLRLNRLASFLPEDTENLSTSSAPEGDVISLVNDTVVKTVEVPDMGTFEPSLASATNCTVKDMFCYAICCTCNMRSCMQ